MRKFKIIMIDIDDETSEHKSIEVEVGVPQIQEIYEKTGINAVYHAMHEANRQLNLETKKQEVLFLPK